jgi:hypothetical protein
MPMPTKRVLYSIHPEVLTRFNALFKGRDRSRMVEKFMIQAIDSRASEVAAAAKLIETDPAFSEYAAVSEWADAQAVDTLARS